MERQNSTQVPTQGAFPRLSAVNIFSRDFFFRFLVGTERQCQCVSSLALNSVFLLHFWCMQAAGVAASSDSCRRPATSKNESGTRYEGVIGQESVTKREVLPMPLVHPLANSPADSLLGVAGLADIGRKSAPLFSAHLGHRYTTAL